MKIHFFSKGPINQVSGGYLYNRYVIDYLRASGVDVSYHAEASQLVAIAEDDLAVIDSLIVVAVQKQLQQLSRRPVILMHMVPTGIGSVVGKSHIIATSNRTRDLLHHSFIGATMDITVVEPGVSQQWATKKVYSNTARQLLCLANYLPGKGHKVLLDMLHKLRHLPWNLRMHGNDELDRQFHAAVVRHVGDLGLQDRVSVNGPVSHDDVQHLLCNADLLLQLSEHESFSMITAEAIACGLPVLSTRTGDSQKFIQSGLVSYLDPDNRDRWDGALADILQDPSRYASMRPSTNIDARSWTDVGQQFLATVRQWA